MSSCCHTTKNTTTNDHHNNHHGDHEHDMMAGGVSMAQDFMRRFIIVTFLLIPLVLLLPPVLSFLGIPDFALRKYIQFGVASIVFYFGIVFFEHAAHEIKMRQYGMMTLVSLAVGAGYLFSVAATFVPVFQGVEFYLEISTLIWILLFGHYLEARSSSAAGDALQEVAKLLPKEAHLLKGKEVHDIPLEELKKDDIVLVKPGEKIPADGVIVSGSAHMDESLISGESKPVSKKKGEVVVAGSICLDSSIEVRLSRVGEHSTIGQIKMLITQAQKTKPTAQKIADKAARVLTFTALFVAIAAILTWSIIIGKPLVFAITLAITVLVIACPHALGLAIPTVSTIATTLAVKNGVFLKDMAKLEVIRNIDYIVFDKTGTLTQGVFGITNIIPLGTKTNKEDSARILAIAASLEKHSSHVIGNAVVSYAQKQAIKLLTVDKFKNLAGKGIEGIVKGKQYLVGNKTLMKEKKFLNNDVEEQYQKLAAEGATVIFVAGEMGIIGLITLADQIKKESYNSIKALHHLGVKVAMLTGDNEHTAATVAKKLGIDTYFANILPEDKYRHVKNLQKNNQTVMMVGDGVNDAPALTQSNVGVAIGAGTDVAVEAGDVVLTRNNPEDIARLVILSKKVYRKMVENLVWATGYNVVAIPAAAGVFAPWGLFLKPEVGALLMSLSSVIVVANALLLKKIQLKVS